MRSSKAPRAALISVALILLFGESAPCQRVMDPKPNVEPFPGGGVDTEETSSRRQRGLFPDPPVIGQRLIWHELHGFAPGAPEHQSTWQFVGSLVTEIRRQENRDKKVVRIASTGFADGLPNEGLNLNLASYPDRCSAGMTPPVFDQGLALLRGCIVLDRIVRSLGGSVPGNVTWLAVDEPDFGSSGLPFRKVRIEISIGE